MTTPDLFLIIDPEHAAYPQLVRTGFENRPWQMAHARFSSAGASSSAGSSSSSSSARPRSSGVPTRSYSAAFLGLCRLSVAGKPPIADAKRRTRAASSQSP